MEPGVYKETRCPEPEIHNEVICLVSDTDKEMRGLNPAAYNETDGFQSEIYKEIPCPGPGSYKEIHYLKAYKDFVLTQRHNEKKWPQSNLEGPGGIEPTERSVS